VPAARARQQQLRELLQFGLPPDKVRITALREVVPGTLTLGHVGL
jgi:hypothetical protein